MGRAVPSRVDLHRARHDADTQLPRPHARAAPVPGARAATTPAGRPPASRLHHRTLERWCDPEAAFVALYGDREHAVWLDSSRAEPGLARFSYMGAPDGPLGQVVRYDVATHTLTIERAGGGAARASTSSTTASANSRACAPMRPSCRSTSPAASPATSATSSRPTRRRAAHRSPLPDAALVFCDRLIAFDHDARRVHLLALGDARRGRRRRMAGGTERALEGSLVAAADRRRPRRRPVVHRTRGSRRLPGQHRRLHAGDLRGRDLRGLPDHRAAQRRRHRPARGLPCPARAQPRATRGAAAARRRLGAQLLARALPARRPRAHRRVQADQGHRRRAGSTPPRTRTARPRCAPTTSRAPRT